MCSARALSCLRPVSNNKNRRHRSLASRARVSTQTTSTHSPDRDDPICRGCACVCVYVCVGVVGGAGGINGWGVRGALALERTATSAMCRFRRGPGVTIRCRFVVVVSGRKFSGKYSFLWGGGFLPLLAQTHAHTDTSAVLAAENAKWGATQSVMSFVFGTNTDGSPVIRNNTNSGSDVFVFTNSLLKSSNSTVKIIP